MRSGSFLVAASVLVLTAVSPRSLLAQPGQPLPRPRLQVIQDARAELEAREAVARQAQIAELEAELAKTQAVAAQLRNTLEQTKKLLANGQAKAEQVKQEAAKLAVTEQRVAELKKKLAAVQGGEPAEDDAATDDDTTTEAAPPRPPLDPREIRLHMADGTVITGKLQSDTLDVETRFGTLTVPIKKIRSFHPGLESRPGLREKIESLIEQLAEENDAQRNAAVKALQQMGPKVSPVLAEYRRDEDAKRRSEVIKLLDSFSEMQDNWESDGDAKLTTQDRIVTTDFTMTGRILTDTFQLESEYGELSMSLADVVKAERDTGEVEEFRKSFALNETFLAARKFKNAGIRVQKGDKVYIQASGTMHLTRWGSNAISTPDGAANYGWYVNGKVPNGALCMKIGDGGDVEKVGTNLKLTAKQSGVLYLGIGMTARYATGNYRFPGTYKVKVKVVRD